MTRIELAWQVFDDFDRFFEHIAQFDPGAAPRRIGEILEVIQILTHSPLIGRPLKDGKRELVIGRATRGYVALYRYVAAIDTVFMLAVRAPSASLGISVKSAVLPRRDRICLKRSTPYLTGRCSAQSLLPSGSRR